MSGTGPATTRADGAGGRLLADLIEDPARVEAVPPGAVAPLLARLAALQSVLAARLLMVTAPTGGDGRGDPVLPADRLLAPEEAAPLLGVSVRWLYRHAKRLPFTRRLSRKALRFSESGLRKWAAAKKA